MIIQFVYILKVHSKTVLKNCSAKTNAHIIFVGDSLTRDI